jgi:putative membrane-bound dehydrogenase-like protein
MFYFLRPASILALVAFLSVPGQAQDAVTPAETIDLLADPELKNFTSHINKDRSITQDRNEVWSITDDGRLHVSGKAWGYLRTNDKYRDYHLVFEYMWGEHTYGTREDRARDCGLLIHSYGKDGNFGDVFINSIEAQLIEGGSGDILTLSAPEEGQEVGITSLTCEISLDRDGETIWTPGGEKRVFPKPGTRNERINWQHRDPDWADVKGYRGKDEIENPVGEWNRMEVICRGDTITILLNGIKVNEGTKSVPDEGWISLQSEAAECWIRRYEIWPLDKFEEKWTPEQRSTNTGYTNTGDSILPRRLPLSPEESQAAWKIHGDYEIQLVAAEPLVCDPVDVVWDENGRMFVAEMRDYPIPSERGDWLSRIRLLKDENGDGKMDSAVTWADNLDHVQGLLPMNGGLLATTRTAVLFLKDSDPNDRIDRADEITNIFQQNEPRHNQLQISCPRWGLDNAIYLNNGLDLKEIYPAGNPDQKVAASGYNLRYDPRTKALTTVSSRGQFGAGLDDWNRRFCCSNRNPTMFAVFDIASAQRNPYAAITTLHEDVQESAAKVRPVKLTHTTSVAHAGTYTAACGMGIYRGNLMADMTGDVFVCDPTANVVTRSKLIANGASFDTERIHGDYEFLASGDDWTRPVHVRNGPDGALYICDMYRRFIDHAIFFPDEFQKTNYLRAGFDHGRIWRVVPKGKTAPKIEALPTDSTALVAELENPNAWQRVEAQRLLIERGDKSIAPAVAKILTESKLPQGRAHALWTLDGLGALTPAHIAAALNDANDGVAENALQLADAKRDKATLLKLAQAGRDRVSFGAVLALGSDESDDVTAAFTKVLANKKAAADPWMRKAILSGSEKRAGRILAPRLKAKAAPAADTVRDFATAIAARGDIAEIGGLLEQLNSADAAPGDGWRFALAEGLSNGLKRSKLKQKSLAAIISAPPEELKGKVEGLQAIVDSANRIAIDRQRSDEDRIAALPLASQQGEEAMLKIVEKLIEQTESTAVQAAACQSLARFNRNNVAEFFFARWDRLGPTPLREALALIAGNSNSGILLMKKMKAGEINKSLMPAMQRWSYGRSKNEEIKTLALELFGTTDDDRAKVVRDFRSGIAKHKGNAKNGEAVFQKAACMTCHKLGEVGVEVGPSLADVRIKPDIALLTDILDPNRAVEERWASYTVTAKDGRVLTGLITGETAEAVEIKMPGGLTETVARDQIAKMETTGFSLMPVGLEGAISKQEMADLLAFLKAR